MREIEQDSLSTYRMMQLLRERPRPWAFSLKEMEGRSTCAVVDDNGAVVVEGLDQTTAAMIVTAINVYADVAYNSLTVLEAPYAHVTRIMPTYEELQARFPEYVHQSYRKGVAFTPVHERADTDRGPCMLPFKYVQYSRRMGDSEMVAAMVQHGLLPALPEETLDFLKAHPEELEQGRTIWVLGARSKDGCVLLAWHHGSGPRLSLRRTARRLGGRDLFLAIPIEALQIAA